MRAVLDTNVVVSALLWGGTPYRLLAAATTGELDLVTSPVLVEELRKVLARPHLAIRLALHQTSIEQAIAFYARLAFSVSPLSVPLAVPADSDDNHVVAAAITAQADFIVTGDRALLSVAEYQGVRIVSIDEALQALTP